MYLSIELCLAPETEDQLITKFGTKDHALLFKKISEMDNVFFNIYEISQNDKNKVIKFTNNFYDDM